MALTQGWGIKTQSREGEWGSTAVPSRHLSKLIPLLSAQCATSPHPALLLIPLQRNSQPAAIMQITDLGNFPQLGALI